ncbi:hypothetical protein ACWIGX_22245 [Streptomyces nigrescens]
MHGPTLPDGTHHHRFSRSAPPRALYHQTKNLLVSYSAKKLGFF